MPAGAGEGRAHRSSGAEVVKPGRTLTFRGASACAEHASIRMLIATMIGTLMALLRRGD